MKKQTLLITTLALMLAGNVQAENRSTFKITNFNGSFIDKAHQIDIKYKSDGGGYTYLMYNQEKLSDDFIDFKGEAVEFGLGISEPWESDLVEADIYFGVGYFSTQYEIEDSVSLTTLDASYGGLSYHIGIDLHPFTNNLDVSLLVKHNGVASNPLNDFNGIINSKRTRTSLGVSYDFEYFELGVSKTNDDLYTASLSFRF
jgi:hypothetical protein